MTIKFDLLGFTFYYKFERFLLSDCLIDDVTTVAPFVSVHQSLML